MQASSKLVGCAGFGAPRFGICLSVAALRGVLKANSREIIAILVVIGLFAIASPARAQALSPSEGVISDPHTGAALGGYDPVAYFLEGRPVHSQGQHQAYHAGKVWFFVSGANRAAFLDDPTPFVPVFGGYDPLAITRGSIVPGSPDVHLVHEGRLYFFRHRENRTAFLATPAIRVDAERVWPEVRRDLSP